MSDTLDIIGRLRDVIDTERAENEQLRKAVTWNEKQRGIQAREIERLRNLLADVQPAGHNVRLHATRVDACWCQE